VNSVVASSLGENERVEAVLAWLIEIQEERNWYIKFLSFSRITPHRDSPLSYLPHTSRPFLR